jgi:hypothetical protein
MATAVAPVNCLDAVLLEVSTGVGVKCKLGRANSFAISQAPQVYFGVNRFFVVLSTAIEWVVTDVFQYHSSLGSFAST